MGNYHLMAVSVGMIKTVLKIAVVVAQHCECNATELYT